MHLTRLCHRPLQLYHMLSGQWPFHSPDEKSLSPNTVMRRAMSVPILFDAPAWSRVSRGARRLIERMLDRDTTSRITAKEALQHPWLLEHTVGHDAAAAGAGAGAAPFGA